MTQDGESDRTDSEKDEHHNVAWTEHDLGIPIHERRCQHCREFVDHIDPSDKSFKSVSECIIDREVTREVRAAEVRIEKLEKHIRSLEDRLSDEKETSKKYKAEKGEALDEVDDLKDKLESAYQRIDKLTDEVKDLEASSSSAKDSYIAKLETLINQVDTSGKDSRHKPLNERIASPRISDDEVVAEHQLGRPETGRSLKDRIAQENREDSVDGSDTGLSQTSKGQSSPTGNTTDGSAFESDKLARNARSRARNKKKKASSPLITTTVPEKGNTTEVPTKATKLADRIAGVVQLTEDMQRDSEGKRSASKAFDPQAFDYHYEKDFSVPPTGMSDSDKYRWAARTPSPSRSMPGGDGTWQQWAPLPKPSPPTGPATHSLHPSMRGRGIPTGPGWSGSSRGLATSFAGGREPRDKNLGLGGYGKDRGRGYGAYRSNVVGGSRESNGTVRGTGEFPRCGIASFDINGVTTEHEVDKLIQSVRREDGHPEAVSTNLLRRLVEDAVVAIPRPAVAEYLLARHQELTTSNKSYGQGGWTFDRNRPYKNPPFRSDQMDNWAKYFEAFPDPSAMSMLPGIIRKPITTDDERRALHGALVIAELVPDRENMTHALREVANALNHSTAGGPFLVLQIGMAKSGRRTRFKPPTFIETGVTALDAFIQHLGRIRFSEREARDIQYWARLNTPVIDSNMTVTPSDIFQFVDLNAMNKGSSTNHNDDVISLV